MASKTIDAKTLKAWLENKEAVLVDVREPAEYASENIIGATLLPLGKINKSLLPPHVGKKLVIHCRKGGRGGSACEKLLAEDPALELYNLEGGIEAWRAAGLAVATSGKSCLPLDRQVQLTIGVILIAANVLGMVFGPAWFLLTALIGVGLTIAGLTGFCGLALVIARMPWNQQSAKSCCCAKK